VSVVREELGPSLPQLLQPHWARLPRRRRLLVVAAAVAGLVLLLAAYEVLRSDPLKSIVVDEPVAFNLIHRADFNPVTPGRGEVLRLQGVLRTGQPPNEVAADESFTVRRLVVPPFRGDISSAYLLLASQKLKQLQAADPLLRYRGEGKSRINLTPGYQLTFQTRAGGRKDGPLVFGRIFWLVPEPADGEEQVREGVELTLLAERSGQTPSAQDIGADILLKAPLRSFRFGTERP
jgi:hypothetical protein